MNIFYFILISSLLAVGSTAVPPKSKNGGPYGYEEKYEAEPVRLRKEWCVQSLKLVVFETLIQLQETIDDPREEGLHPSSQVLAQETWYLWRHCP